jgi:deoxyribonuclease IV
MYGFHLKEYDKNIKDLLISKGCTIYQCFKDEYKNCLLYQPELKPILHGSFYINLASLNKFSTYTLIDEINFCLNHDINYYVVHMGKCTKKLKIEKKECILNMLKTLKYVCKKLKLYENDKFNLCVELLSGENNDMLYDFRKLYKYFFNKEYVNHQKKYFKNLKICFDTCHVFASGYNINDIDFFNKLMKFIKKTLKLERIALVHFNNSVFKLNERKDQHADIDNGEISIESMLYIFQYFIKHKIPLLLELKNIKTNINYITF